MEATAQEPREAVAVNVGDAARLTTLSPKAIRSRLDRHSLRSVLKNGQRHIPMTELYRAGLLNPDGSPARQAQQGSERQGQLEGSPEASFNVMELIDELTEARADAKVKGLLAQQAETLAEGERQAREALETELHAARCRVAELEERIGRRRWFKRTPKA